MESWFRCGRFRPNQGLRRHVMEVFDQTFRITYALQAVSITVAILGIINTLAALTLQRGREIGRTGHSDALDARSWNARR